MPWYLFQKQKCLNQYALRPDLNQLNKVLSSNPYYKIIHVYDTVMIVEYYKNHNLYHKKTFLNSKIKREEWFGISCILHNLSGPALIEYKNDIKCLVAYYVDGVLHRDDGPAIFEFKDFNITEKYFRHGKEIDFLLASKQVEN